MCFLMRGSINSQPTYRCGTFVDGQREQKKNLYPEQHIEHKTALLISSAVLTTKQQSLTVLICRNQS